MALGRSMTRPLCGGVLMGLVLLMSSACGVSDHEPAQEQAQSGSHARMSFEEFLSHGYEEPGENGVYVYDGDLTATSLDELRQAYERMFPAQELGTTSQGLAIHLWNGYMYFRSSSFKRNLRYCISNDFGSFKPKMVEAMNAAASA